MSSTFQVNNHKFRRLLPAENPEHATPVRRPKPGPGVTARSKRSSVTAACEACRKNKTRVSGSVMIVIGALTNCSVQVRDRNVEAVAYDRSIATT